MSYPRFICHRCPQCFCRFYKCFKFTRNCILIKSIQRNHVSIYVNPNTSDICLIPWNIWSILIFSWPWERSRRYVLGPEGGREGRWHPPAPTESLQAPAPALRVQLGLGRTGTGPQVILCSHWSRQITWPEHWPLIGPGRGGQHSRAWTPSSFLSWLEICRDRDIQSNWPGYSEIFLFSTVIKTVQVLINDNI